MLDKTPERPMSSEMLTVVAAFIFVGGLLLSSSSLMILAALLIAVRLSIHVASFARPVPAHFRKHRPQVRYSR